MLVETIRNNYLKFVVYFQKEKLFNEKIHSLYAPFDSLDFL